MKPAPPVTRTRIAAKVSARRPEVRRASAPRQPPVPLAEQAHRRRDDQQPHERRVEQDRDAEPRAELLQRRRAGDDEREEDRHHHERGARDDPRRPNEPFRDGALVVAVLEPALAHARQQEHLVVHREAEGHREHERRNDRLHVAGRVVPGPVEPAPLEHGDEHAVRGADAEQVHQHRFERQEHAAQQEQQDDVARREDHEQHLPEAAEDRVRHVQVEDGAAADDGARGRRRPGSAATIARAARRLDRHRERRVDQPARAVGAPHRRSDVRDARNRGELRPMRAVGGEHVHGRAEAGAGERLRVLGRDADLGVRAAARRARG